MIDPPQISLKNGELDIIRDPSMKQRPNRFMSLREHRHPDQLANEYRLGQCGFYEPQAGLSRVNGLFGVPGGDRQLRTKSECFCERPNESVMR